MKLKLPFTSFSIYYFGLIVMAIGLPLSPFMMSISQFIMLGACLFDHPAWGKWNSFVASKGIYFYPLFFPWFILASLGGRFRQLFSDRTALIISSIYLLHLIGLLYTTDMDFGLRDTRIKIPLLLMPLVISTMPRLNTKQFRILLYVFCAAVFTGTMIGSGIMFGMIKKEITDIRQVSIFVSHIRFSLMICLSVFILAYYSIRERKYLSIILHVVFILWLSAYMVIIESLTGVFILLLEGSLLLAYFIFKRGNLLARTTFIASLAISIWFITHALRTQVNDFFVVRETADIHHLDSVTAHGHPYLNDLKNNALQNGYFTGIYQCWEEMELAWNKKSKIKFSDLDKKGNQIRFTIVRYVSSKGLRKDQEGIEALNANDIENIENGYPDSRYPGLPTLKMRVEGIIWEFNEYSKGNDPSGHSVTQRFEFWRTAKEIISQHFLFGVGTGDPGIAFAEQYKINGTQLKEKYRLRSHNQFLAMGVAFGIIGVIWFLISFFYPVLLRKNRKDLLFMLFFIIAFISMINEDTLETQAGVTFFAFFNSLFLFAQDENSGS